MTFKSQAKKLLSDRFNQVLVGALCLVTVGGGGWFYADYRNKVAECEKAESRIVSEIMQLNAKQREVSHLLGKAEKISEKIDETGFFGMVMLLEDYQDTLRKVKNLNEQIETDISNNHAFADTYFNNTVCLFPERTKEKRAYFASLVN